MPKTRRADIIPAERLAVSVSVAGTRARISASKLQRLARHVLRAEKVRDAMLSVAFVSPRAIAALNEKYLAHEGATDVISFALGDAGASAAIGDIYICPVVARANAKRFGGTFGGELERLVVHGVLHVLDWDHPEGDARVASPMWKRQEQLLRSWHRGGSK